MKTQQRLDKLKGEDDYTRLSMRATPPATEDHDGPVRYEFRLKGHLDDRWAGWFEGLTITREANGETRLRGLVVDQAALHGFLRTVRDLGMPLIAVMQVHPTHTDGTEDNTDIDYSTKEPTP